MVCKVANESTVITPSRQGIVAVIRFGTLLGAIILAVISVSLEGSIGPELILRNLEWRGRLC